MNKKQRVEAIIKGEVPDYMPVFAYIWTHGVFSSGNNLPDITGQDFVDSEKSAKAAFDLLQRYDLDIVYGSYCDMYLGLTSLGGVIKIPDGYGATVVPEKFPVEDPLDWPQVKKKLTSIFEKNNRLTGVLESYRIVAKEVGDQIPIAVTCNPGPTSAVGLLRDIESLCLDMSENADFAYEICDYANKYTIEFIRRQYDAGANSVTLLGDVFGTQLISPDMFKQFVLPFIAEIVDVVKKEFNQKVFVHLHGDFKPPKANALLDILVNEIGVGALHLDESHDSSWVKENICDKYKIPGAITYHAPELIFDSIEKIDRKTKELVIGCNQNYSFMAPSCEAPPNIQEDHLKSWVQKTHEYSAEYYWGKRDV